MANGQFSINGLVYYNITVIMHYCSEVQKNLLIL